MAWISHRICVCLVSAVVAVAHPGVDGGGAVVRAARGLRILCRMSAGRHRARGPWAATGARSVAHSSTTSIRWDTGDPALTDRMAAMSCSTMGASRGLELIAGGGGEPNNWITKINVKPPSSIRILL